MNATELQEVVAGRAKELTVAVRQYIDGRSSAKDVHALLNTILTEAEADERWKLPVAQEEEALWSLVWSAQHLCGSEHSMDLARERLEPILQALEQRTALPKGMYARRPRSAA